MVKRFTMWLVLVYDWRIVLTPSWLHPCQGAEGLSLSLELVLTHLSRDQFTVGIVLVKPRVKLPVVSVPFWVQSMEYSSGANWESLWDSSRAQQLALVWDLSVWCPFISTNRGRPPTLPVGLIPRAHSYSGPIWPQLSPSEHLYTAGSRLSADNLGTHFPAVLRWLCGSRCPVLKLGISLDTLSPEVYNRDISVLNTV